MAHVPARFSGTPTPTLVVAGGVAANQAIGAALAKLAGRQDFAIRIPPPRLCTDNAAMIAWAGLERLAAGARAIRWRSSPGRAGRLAASRSTAATVSDGQNADQGDRWPVRRLRR